MKRREDPVHNVSSSPSSSMPWTEITGVQGLHLGKVRSILRCYRLKVTQPIASRRHMSCKCPQRRFRNRASESESTITDAAIPARRPPSTGIECSRWHHFYTLHSGMKVVLVKLLRLVPFWARLAGEDGQNIVGEIRCVKRSTYKTLSAANAAWTVDGLGREVHSIVIVPSTMTPGTIPTALAFVQDPHPTSFSCRHSTLTGQPIIILSSTFDVIVV